MRMIRLSDDNYELVSILAKADDRSIANMLDRIVSVSGMKWDELDAQDREESKQARDFVVREGIELGKLKERPKQPDGHEGYEGYDKPHLKVVMPAEPVARALAQEAADKHLTPSQQADLAIAQENARRLDQSQGRSY